MWVTVKQVRPPAGIFLERKIRKELLYSTNSQLKNPKDSLKFACELKLLCWGLKKAIVLGL